MDKKNKDNTAYWAEKIQSDEMQRALSYELEHKTLRLWYILNSFVMYFSMFIFVGTEDPAWAVPPSIQILLLAQYGVMLFCLSLYNLRASSKGVLDSFSRYQKGFKGLEFEVAMLSLIIPMTPIMTYIMNKDSREHYRPYLAFFIVWLCMAYAYECINWYCVKRNKKVLDKMAEDDEAEETEEE